MVFACVEMIICGVGKEIIWGVERRRREEERCLKREGDEELIGRAVLVLA
jgi:hypothetical protein